MIEVFDYGQDLERDGVVHIRGIHMCSVRMMLYTYTVECVHHVQPRLHYIPTTIIPPPKKKHTEDGKNAVVSVDTNIHLKLSP